MGRGVKYFSKLGVAEFTVDAAEFSVGDKLLITGPTTGVIYLDATEIRYDLKPVPCIRANTSRYLCLTRYGLATNSLNW